MKHFISMLDHTSKELNRIFDVAFALRENRSDRHEQQKVLFGKTIAMIFEKPSLRTRVSFEQAMLELGGVKDVVGKTLGSRNPINIVYATMEALRQLRDPSLEMARRFGTPKEESA